MGLTVEWLGSLCWRASKCQYIEQFPLVTFTYSKIDSFTLPAGIWGLGVVDWLVLGHSIDRLSLNPSIFYHLPHTTLYYAWCSQCPECVWSSVFREYISCFLGAKGVDRTITWLAAWDEGNVGACSSIDIHFLFSCILTLTFAVLGISKS